MGEDERALAKAVESGDTDLVYLAVFHLQKHVSEKVRVERLCESQT
jgi:hypothetical protein